MALVPESLRAVGVGGFELIMVPRVFGRLLNESGYLLDNSRLMYCMSFSSMFFDEHLIVRLSVMTWMRSVRSACADLSLFFLRVNQITR